MKKSDFASFTSELPDIMVPNPDAMKGNGMLFLSTAILAYLIAFYELVSTEYTAHWNIFLIAIAMMMVPTFGRFGGLLKDLKGKKSWPLSVITIMLIFIFLPPVMIKHSISSVGIGDFLCVGYAMFWISRICFWTADKFSKREEERDNQTMSKVVIVS